MMEQDFNILMGRRLRKIREQKELKQETVAQLLGVSQQAYSQLENGCRNFTPAVISKICEVLEVNMVDFLGFGGVINVSNGQVYT